MRQLQIKQELVRFFDRRLTHLVGVVTRCGVSLQGSLLRVGDGVSCLREMDGDGLDTGGEWGAALAERNRCTWTLLTGALNGDGAAG